MEMKHLLLTRTVDESIIVGGNVHISINKNYKNTDSRHIKFSIWAPEEIIVDRGEIAVLKILLDNPDMNDGLMVDMLTRQNFGHNEICRGMEIYNKQQENKDD